MLAAAESRGDEYFRSGIRARSRSNSERRRQLSDPDFFCLSIFVWVNGCGALNACLVGKHDDDQWRDGQHACASQVEALDTGCPALCCSQQKLPDREGLQIARRILCKRRQGYCDINGDPAPPHFAGCDTSACKCWCILSTAVLDLCETLVSLHD